MDGVKLRLQNYFKDVYEIVIFTSQAYEKFNLEKFTEKIQKISKLIEVPILVFGCTDYGYCRKPCVGLWKLLTLNNDNIEIDMTKSFYVGDAAGRYKDFSDSDLKFALNVNIKFYSNIKMKEIN